MIAIHQRIKEKCPQLKLWIIKGSINNHQVGSTSHLVEKVAQDPSYYDTRNEPIVEARTAYKALGKEPSRYRPSAEALRRRIKSGKGLYKISPAVDIINIISIKSGLSIGGYNYDAIHLPIQLQPGGEEEYRAVGRGVLNIAHLPCLYDTEGPFGSPTSDSVRTMITPETSALLMVFFDFGAYLHTEKYLNEAQQLLEKYCTLSAEHIGLL